MNDDEGWLETGSHTACPACESQDVRVRQQLRAEGPAHLTGTQLKYEAVTHWVYRCFNCQRTGPALPKDDGGGPLS